MPPKTLCLPQAPIDPRGMSFQGAGATAIRALDSLIGAPFTPLQVDRLRHAARGCAERGLRTIALYGGGRHTARVIRQPWSEFDVRVVCVFDDADDCATNVRGVPVFRPSACPREVLDQVQCVVVSSDAHEDALRARAEDEFGPRGRTRAGVPIVTIYGGRVIDTLADLRERLIDHWGVEARDADWLIENRFERHDASLPMLPPERTEMHLRRYEFAALLSKGRRCLDAACGTGYGAGVLMGTGAARSYVGVDIDAQAVDYAQRRHGAGGGGGKGGAGTRGTTARASDVRFVCASAAETGLGAASADLAVSFETIEHMPDPAAFIEELSRVLTVGGTLVLSTPNDTGPTNFHVQSFTRASLAAVLERRFTDLCWFGQWTIGVPTIGAACAGIHSLEGFGHTTRMHELGAHAREPEHWIVVAQRRD